MTAVMHKGTYEASILTQGMAADKDGYRTYNVSALVRAAWDDGPERIYNTPGLPLTGSMWNFGNDLDVWAFCRPQIRISIFKERQGDGIITDDEGTKGRLWKVDNTFSVSKPGDTQRCQDTEIEDPCLEPPKVGGSFSKNQFEPGWGYPAVDDTYGAGTGAAAGGTRTFPIMTPSFEPLKGVSVDDGLDNVHISINSYTLGLSTFSDMKHTLNDAPLWGLAARCIKLSAVSWERNLTGSCDYYYTRAFEFEINPNTFDLTVPAYGKMELKVDGDPTDQDDFNRQQDEFGNLRSGFIKENGFRANVYTEAHPVPVIYYKESNFLLLGIPTSF